MGTPDLESRVAKLGKALPAFSQELHFALHYIRPDPGSSLTKARAVLEKLLSTVYATEMGRDPRRPLLGDMLIDNQFTRKVERRILARMDAIRGLSNLGPHGESVEPSDVTRVLDDLCDVLEWYLRRYAVTPPAAPEGSRSAPTGDGDQFAAVGPPERPLSDSERTAIIQLVTQLGDRRLLAATECKVPRCDMIESAQKIRDAITKTLLGLEKDSASRRPLIDIRIACQTFQKFMEEN